VTLQEAKSIARHLGLTLRKVHSGDYRMNFRDGNETTAYYRDNLEDAVKTAVEMACKRALELHHTEPGRDGITAIIHNGETNHATDTRSPYCRPRHRLLA
jgi:hypothetical protein